MSPATIERRRHPIARIAHVAGDTGWWVFVVARLIVEMDSYELPRRYADYRRPLFSTLFSLPDRGWTTYTPVTDQVPPGLHDRFLASDIISACVVGALAVVIFAAAVEAIADGSWPSGVGTIAAPIVGAAVILSALYVRTGDFIGGLQLHLVIVLALVLVGVAFRQVWSQAFAPRWSSMNGQLNARPWAGGKER